VQFTRRQCRYYFLYCLLYHLIGDRPRSKSAMFANVSMDITAGDLPSPMNKVRKKSRKSIASNYMMNLVHKSRLDSRRRSSNKHPLGKGAEAFASLGLELATSKKTQDALKSVNEFTVEPENKAPAGDEDANKANSQPGVRSVLKKQTRSQYENEQKELKSDLAEYKLPWGEDNASSDEGEDARDRRRSYIGMHVFTMCCCSDQSTSYVLCICPRLQDRRVVYAVAVLCCVLPTASNIMMSCRWVDTVGCITCGPKTEEERC